MLEVEVKIKVNNEDIVNKLESLAFVKTSIVYEHDIYFNGEHKNLKEEDKALRVREYKDYEEGKSRFLLNFKGPRIDSSTMTREETEFEIPSFESGESLFNGLGFYKAGEVEKIRVHYDKDEIECCLDKVTGLGEFFEIEIMAEEADYDDAMSRIKDLLAKLNLSIEDSIRRSYLGMLQDKLK